MWVQVYSSPGADRRIYVTHRPHPGCSCFRADGLTE